MKELLEEFAQKAHLLGLHTQHLGATLLVSDEPVVLGTGNYTTLGDGWAEAENAAAVFLVLDAIEKKGVAISVGSTSDEDGRLVPGYGASWYDLNNCVPGYVENCKTRTEAVIRAALELCKHQEVA